MSREFEFLVLYSEQHVRILVPFLGNGIKVKIPSEIKPPLAAKYYKVNSVQEACAKYFAVHLSKFGILQTIWKNKTKNMKTLNLSVKNWILRSDVLCFIFFMWFARFQILMYVNRKAFGSSALYRVDFTFGLGMVSDPSKLLYEPPKHMANTRNGSHVEWSIGRSIHLNCHYL